ncbi:sigma-70 family RNA polymerase sigma factor [Baekduia sp.]|uniref:RNA polymerase sigma factor n=1 Tax=Baekduia sp. TaxID=2600305 RepID=UPI002D1FB20B|nr:sigma-70 family RNA polymerase sigma factor [Baekduia sp.]
MRLQSDERLAELAIDGHEAAFAAIVDRYRTPLLRYCAGIVGASRAEDAVQQVLINAHDALTRTNDVRHLRSWLYRIAHNASLNVLRAVRDDLPLDHAQVAATDGPAAAFEQSERLRATLDAVHELPERQRAALVLRELEGRSHEEIADALGVTKGSARQHLMRARTAVRGAVTAITPYPLIAKLAELVSSPAAGSWSDAAVGAGAGATVAKLTAGVMATGALVGGAVGTDQVIHRQHRQADAASTQTTRTGHAKALRAVAPPARTTQNAALVLPASSSTKTQGGSGTSGTGERGGSGAGAGSGSSGSSGSSGRDASGQDDQRDDGDRSGRGSGDDSRIQSAGGKDSGGSDEGSGGSSTSSGSAKRSTGDATRDRGGDESDRSTDDSSHSGSASGSSGEDATATAPLTGSSASGSGKDAGGTPSVDESRSSSGSSADTPPSSSGGDGPAGGSSPSGSGDD